MKRSWMAIALFVVVTGCDRGTRSVTAPVMPPAPAPLSGFFTLSGRIEDTEGGGLSGARVQLTTDSTIQTTLSGDGGQYRFDNVRGNAALRVSKDGFIEAAPFVYVAKDQTLNVALQPRLTLVPGATVRGTVKSPPCDPNWDNAAPCQRVSFIPPVTGDYELVLTWTGAIELDLLVDASMSLYWSSTTGQIRALVPGFAGTEREIRIQSYYGPQAFELTASLKSAP